MAQTHEQHRRKSENVGGRSARDRARAKLRALADRSPSPSELADQVQLSFVGRAAERVWKALGGRYIAGISANTDALRTGLRAIPDRMQKLTNQANLALELIDDFKAGRYRNVRWRNIALGAAALLYSVSPADVIPDFIPGLGALDDAALLAIAMKLVKKDLERYCDFKGYERAQYF